MKKLEWFERRFISGFPKGMLPFHLERLEGTLSRIKNKIQGIHEDLLSSRLNEKWSIKQNIGHLAEVDEIGLIRIDEIRKSLPSMSPAVFALKQDYNSKTVEEVIDYFKKNRLANLEKYKSLLDQELENASLHPRLKIQMTPVDLAWFEAEHDDHHLVRINEIISSLTKK